jgi:membrane protein YqaA with SNARE-associated domain
VAAVWRRVAGGRAAPWVCFAWAFGEATLFPVIPDAALLVLALGAPRRSLRLLGATLVGSALGGTVTVVVASLAPQAALGVVTHVPLVHASSIAGVRAHLAAHPLLESFLYQPWSGVPFKLWAVLAGGAGAPPAAVIPSFVVGRLLRFAVAAWLGWAAGRLLERRLGDVAVPLLLTCAPGAAWVFWRVAIAG